MQKEQQQEEELSSKKSIVNKLIVNCIFGLEYKEMIEKSTIMKLQKALRVLVHDDVYTHDKAGNDFSKANKLIFKFFPNHKISDIGGIRQDKKLLGEIKEFTTLGVEEGREIVKTAIYQESPILLQVVNKAKDIIELYNLQVRDKHVSIQGIILFKSKLLLLMKFVNDLQHGSRKEFIRELKLRIDAYKSRRLKDFFYIKIMPKIAFINFLKIAIVEYTLEIAKIFNHTQNEKPSFYIVPLFDSLISDLRNFLSSLQDFREEFLHELHDEILDCKSQNLKIFFEKNIEEKIAKGDLSRCSIM